MTWHEKWEMESAFLVLQQIFEIMATPEKIKFFKNVDIPFKKTLEIRTLFSEQNDSKYKLVKDSSI